MKGKQLLRKSELFRLVLVIIIMFILCLPEFFKIHEANTVIVSCMDTCSANNTTFPLCTFNNSCKRSVQQRRENQTILLKAIVNHSNFQNIPCICQSSRREQQSHTKHTGCESKRDVNVDHRGSGSVVKKTRGSLEVKTEDVIYFYKYFNLTIVSEKEGEHNIYYMLEIQINNSIVGGRNAAGEYLNHSCLVAMMEDQNDCINISLQLKSYVEFPMCMTKIIWLTMIPVVFVFTISIVIYKIVQENEQNSDCKHRVATFISTILRRKGSRHARRTISATKILPFPVKTSKQESPLTAQTTKILPIIPEQEHCHVGASTVEVLRNDSTVVKVIIKLDVMLLKAGVPTSTGILGLPVGHFCRVAHEEMSRSQHRARDSGVEADITQNSSYLNARREEESEAYSDI
ncbi:transmembrane protein 156 [Athene cunicularia]|uniref:transmembrane protein 156 n=1 Tax=Athene cunicularia TaxID=194338 RepID=UPI000EF6C42D|nr:transmembrane protein 156 [Athene cunicularia]